MAEVLDFDPATELQVLETFSFEEEVERDVSVRFYPLDEQVIDYFERRVPSGAVSRQTLEKLQREADRMRALYERIVQTTETAQQARHEREVARLPSWITPIHDLKKPYQLRTQNWVAAQTPLFAANQPRFQDRFVAGLPRPQPASEGPKLGLSYALDQVSPPDPAIRVLPRQERTRGVVHTGGRQEVVAEPIPNTEDDVAYKGQFIGKRGVDLIAPLEGHPILGDASEHAWETQAPYKEIVPSVEAILTHGVPVTTHPFRDAAPYLKVQDVRWNEIPWAAWKRQFPPAEEVTTGLPVEPIAWPGHNPDIPSESLQKEQTVPYLPGMASRFWLAQQRDAGGLVAKMLLTKASEHGIVALPNPAEPAPGGVAAANPKDCMNPDMAFEEFVTAGIQRPPGMCVPVETILRERAEVGTKGRKPWGETTEADILEEQRRELAAAQGPAAEPPKEAVLPKVSVPPLSALREDVLAILADKQRTDSDKVKDLLKLTKDMPVKGRLYLDEESKFLLCQHTIAVLSGDLAKDRMEFQANWCAIVGGSRVCKNCGEAVNRDVMTAKDEFDDAGHATIHTEALARPEFHPGGVRSFAENLQMLKPLFNIRDPAQDAFFLLLSVMQMLPDQAQLEPVLGQVKRLSELTKSKGAAAQAVVGVGGLILLMQIHDPFLVPRRSFGMPFLVTGFPREGDAGDKGILDSVLAALKKTFEQFRGSFQGASQPLLRAVFKDTAQVRKDLVTTLKVLTRPPPAFVTKFNLTDQGDRLDLALQRQAKAPPVPPAPQSLIPNFRIDSTEPAKHTHIECEPATHTTFWTTAAPPKILQKPLVFDKVTDPGPLAHLAKRTTPPTGVWGELPKDTASRLKDLPAFVRNLPGGLARVLGDRSIPWRTAAAIAGRLLDHALGVPGVRELRKELDALDPTKNSPANLRDAARGIAYAVCNAAAGVPAVREKWAQKLPKDLALKALLRAPGDVELEVRALTTKERTNFVNRLKEKSDTEREQVKQLLDIGLAPYYIVNREERAVWAQELERTIAPAKPEVALGDNPDMPEGGFPAGPPDERERDDPDQGEGGDYGDMPNRPQEGNDEQGEMPELETAT